MGNEKGVELKLLIPTYLVFKVLELINLFISFCLDAGNKADKVFVLMWETVNNQVNKITIHCVKSCKGNKWGTVMGNNEILNRVRKGIFEDVKLKLSLHITWQEWFRHKEEQRQNLYSRNGYKMASGEILWDGNVLYLDCVNGNTQVVTVYYGSVRCYHWGKLGKDTQELSHYYFFQLHVNLQ